MALTKLPKNAFGTGSVDSDKIEDGTIQATDISGSIANDRLVNSSVTVNGSSVSLGGSASLAGYLDWQSVITADGSTTTTAVAGEGYIVDTTSASHTINLPASASIGDTIAIKDYAGTFGTNSVVIGKNGHNIQGVDNNAELTTNRASVVLVYVDATKGWLYTNEHNVGDLQGPTFISASGGTEATSGDFKIHTFTGDGCFVVSQLGNSPVVPTGGPSNVDYLVVAGGGGGGKRSAGGGGAGGYRTTFPSPGCNAGAFPVSVTTYPITVGSGGTGDATGSGCSTKGGSGFNSVFSTITSTGGGGGNGLGATTGGDGGSGGGGNSGTPNAGGSGNTPPVSPSQGNNGGTGFDAPGSDETGAGGGGAGAVGGNGASGTAGSGGNGSSNSITGSPITYAGGGGGSSYKCGSGTRTPGSGGTGGGGAGGGGTSNLCAVSGTVNSGGGGGAGCTSKPSGAGGKGIVVIRYKYQ